jgi:hypothetical protein
MLLHAGYRAAGASADADEVRAQIVLSNYVYGRRGVEQRAQEAVEQTGGYS